MVDAIFSWVSGGVPASARLAVAIAPVAVVIGLLLAGMTAFAIRNRAGHGYHDAELERRGATPFIGMWLRRCFSWLTAPAVGLLVKSGISPNAITATSAVLATGAAVAVASGHMGLGGWLFALSGLCDFLDGRVARATSRSSARGALLDSVLDRYVEGALFVGLAWFYRGSWLLLCVGAALVGSLLVSYVRARGEGLGVRFRNVGMVQRPERVVLLTLALTLSPVLEAALDPANEHPMHRLVAAAVALLAITTHVSAIQRLVYAYRALPPPEAPSAQTGDVTPDSATHWTSPGPTRFR